MNLLAAFSRFFSSRKVHGWEFAVPSLDLSLAHIAVSVTDWVVAGSVLYALLPPAATLSFPGFLGMFLLAQAAGLASNVPGGLGVFETVMQEARILRIACS